MQAKGGRERLRKVHSLAIFLKPAQVNFAGNPTTMLCVFPDRYFEFDGAGVGMSQRALVVDGASDRAASDMTGMPRRTRHLSPYEHDRLILNQLVYLLDSAWLQPHPMEARKNILIVEIAGRSFKLFLNKANLPERILALKVQGRKQDAPYDFRLQQYRDFDGIMLPGRVATVGRVSQSTWDADYEVDAKYNPKLFERVPDLSNGPEPWRMR